MEKSTVEAWLDTIKRGYGSRFALAFELLGVEDSDDIANIDTNIYRDIEATLTQSCGAKVMHLKNIRLALLELGCVLEAPPKIKRGASGEKKDRSGAHSPARRRKAPSAKPSASAAAALAPVQGGGGGRKAAAVPKQTLHDSSADACSVVEEVDISDNELHHLSLSRWPAQVEDGTKRDRQEERGTGLAGWWPFGGGEGVGGSGGAGGGSEASIRGTDLDDDDEEEERDPLDRDDLGDDRQDGGARPPPPSQPTRPPQAVHSAPQSAPPLPPALGRTDSGFAREAQWEEYQKAVAAAAQAAQAAHASHAAQAQALAVAHASSSSGLWQKLARGVETEAELHAFFGRRQARAVPDGRKLQIASAVKVENKAALHAFASAGGLTMNAMRAFRNSDTLLFHGCPQASATNIQADGMCMSFAASGMLGRGLYGAPDPRKSERYCKDSKDGKFMFVCRFNLMAAKRAGPSTQHRNSVYDEFCVFDDRHVVVLWMLKLA
jgi:hypothetical protein